MSSVIYTTFISEIVQSKWSRTKLIGGMIEFRTNKTCNYYCMAMHTLKEAEPYMVHWTWWFDKK